MPLLTHHPRITADTLQTFGPVVGIMKVESDEEALTLMNDSPYGLVRPCLSAPKTSIN